MNMRKISVATKPLVNIAMQNSSRSSVRVSVDADLRKATITIEVSSGQSRHTIVRLLNEDDKIIRMFSWYLLNGVNSVTLDNLNKDEMSGYWLDLLDYEGNTIFVTQILDL
jgi:hypothetical protein